MRASYEKNRRASGAASGRARRAGAADVLAGGGARAGGVGAGVTLGARSGRRAACLGPYLRPTPRFRVPSRPPLRMLQNGYKFFSQRWVAGAGVRLFPSIEERTRRVPGEPAGRDPRTRRGPPNCQAGRGAVVGPWERPPGLSARRTRRGAILFRGHSARPRTCPMEGAPWKSGRLSPKTSLRP